MIKIIVAHADQGTSYVPAPCRGVVANAYCVFQTNTVEPNDTVVLARGASTVNTITAVTTAGLVVETGVPDATNKGLVFDPASSTAANQVIKITDTGAPGAKLVMIDFDDSAYVAEAASEA
jgi:exo-beta-1,3-glucanase (GH17 family)